MRFGNNEHVKEKIFEANRIVSFCLFEKKKQMDEH